ncbi:interleukin-15 receptor subunit alpha-like isoform X1 [Leucoraja erinacea]|uniref:interleukin-15 receptor subunit alpha-like isoform X1 n=1 Tax=Leucoraja erinaceus TaxID=7782 RepID=UPI002457D239|nr:interleukin-15 receptor subunit alpha-like isoform X1 [Leucoraja erinacea]
MAWIKQFLLLWSIIHESLASKDTCSKPNFNIENVDMSDIMETQFEVGRKLRLKCQRGYKRKAGKSNLIKCQNGSEFAKWSDPILQCIWMGGTPPATPSTSSTEIPKDLTPTVHSTSAMTSLATSVEPTSVEPTSVEPTSVEPTSVEPETSGTTAEHYTTTTVTSETLGSTLSSVATTLTAAGAVKSTALTTATRPPSVTRQTSTIPPLVTNTSGGGPLNTTRTAVRSTSNVSTVATGSSTPVPSGSKQSTAAETTVMFSTTGMEAVTTRTALAETSVHSSTTSETTSEIASTAAVTDISRTVPAGKSLGLVIGASTSSCFVILLVILIFIWPLVCKNRTWCTRPGVAEHELTPMALTEVQTVENLSECGLLQQEAES